jgi:hypothetical protein
LLLRPTHSRVIMAAAITGRESTARYSAMRGRVARYGGKADLIRKRWRWVDALMPREVGCHTLAADRREHSGADSIDQLALFEREGLGNPGTVGRVFDVN